MTMGLRIAATSSATSSSDQARGLHSHDHGLGKVVRGQHAGEDHEGAPDLAEHPRAVSSY